jgi:1,4-dihydroxy-2-naphthoate octaprenyltransferase
MASPAQWIAGARPRTLPAAVAPVLAGTAVALWEDGAVWWKALLALAVSLLLQVGVNYANDYSDGVRGTDADRVGPMRLVGSGAASASSVKVAALASLAAAGLVGLVLAATTSWWLVVVGLVSVAAAWCYTGGPNPYGYLGLGELFVFVFFGLVATVGTTFVQVLAVPQEAWFGAVGAGMLACAVLLANNLRDIDQDRTAHKRTLTVLIGRRWTRVLFTVFVLAPFVISSYLALFYPIAWLTLLALLAALPAILIVWTYRLPRELIVALSLTSVTSLAYGAFLLWAFIG